ncbi:MAG: hypothetical protein WCD35_18600 [Mycobacteriales bacterium]
MATGDAGTSGGVEGNGRLTGTLGVVLLVLLFAEGLTVLDIEGLLTPHVFLGVLVVPPAAAKIATTTYRFARYYARSPEYVRRGPPHPLLRLTGPLLVLSTVVLLASGLWLVAVRRDQADVVLTVHKAGFVVWFGLMTVHVLGHLRDVFALAARDWRPRVPGGRAGRGLRVAGTLLVLALGVGSAVVVTPQASSWTDRVGEDLGER